MAYRNGTYVAFHANGTNVPGGNSDIDYYQLLRAWSARPDDDFTLINSHEKVAAVRDSSAAATLRRSLHERLKNSKNLLLILGRTTKYDTDWVPFEIAQAVDRYEIPIIAAYTEYKQAIRNPSALAGYWPQALAERINNSTAHVIHIPFRKPAIFDAIAQFSHNRFPNGGGRGIYDDDTYRAFGIEG